VSRLRTAGRPGQDAGEGSGSRPGAGWVGGCRPGADFGKIG